MSFFLSSYVTNVNYLVFAALFGVQTIQFITADSILLKLNLLYSIVSHYIAVLRFKIKENVDDFTIPARLKLDYKLQYRYLPKRQHPPLR